MKQSKNHCESSEIPNVCSRNAIWGKLKIRVDLQEIRVEIKSKMHTRILATKSLKQFYESTLKSPASASPAPPRTHRRPGKLKAGSRVPTHPPPLKLCTGRAPSLLQVAAGARLAMDRGLLHGVQERAEREERESLGEWGQIFRERAARGEKIGQLSQGARARSKFLMRADCV